MEYLLLALISFLVSVGSGLLGIGGAVLLILAYLAIPPLVGMQPLDVKGVTGMTSVQVFAASLLGAALHNKKGRVDKTVVLSVRYPCGCRIAGRSARLGAC